jgi:hypothetical protein
MSMSYKEHVAHIQNVIFFNELLLDAEFISNWITDSYEDCTPLFNGDMHDFMDQEILPYVNSVLEDVEAYDSKYGHKTELVRQP